MVYPGGLSCHRNESSTHRARRTTFEFPDKDGKTKTRAISDLMSLRVSRVIRSSITPWKQAVTLSLHIQLAFQLV
jgi:hypothetical protein